MQRHLYELHYNLGCLLHSQGDLWEAVEHYRQATILNPSFAPAYYNLGISLEEQGQLSKAIAEYRRAIALQPNAVRILNNLAFALVRQGHAVEATQIYRQAIALDPTKAILHNNLGLALAKSNPTGAMAAYCQAIKLDPDLAIAHYSLGKLLQQHGQYADAAAHVKAVTQLDPQNSQAYGDLVEIELAQANWAEAMDYLQKAIALQPAFIEAFCQRNHALTSSDELARAKTACTQFLRALQHQLDPVKTVTYLANTYSHLGNVLTEYGGDLQYQQAEVYYQKALRIQPQRLDLYLQLGTCLTKQHRFNAAILVYHLALTFYPNHPQLYIQLGSALEQQQQLEKAIEYYQKALAIRKSGEGQECGGIKTTTAPKVLHAAPFPKPRSVYASSQAWSRAVHFASSDTPLNLEGHRNQIASEAVPIAPHNPCHGINCPFCLQHLFQQFELIHQGKGVYTWLQHDVVASETEPPFISIIPQGRTWIAPQQNSWKICNAIATLTSDNDLLADLSRDYPGTLPGCQKADPQQHRIFTETNLPPLESIDGTVAVLAGLSGHVYFHWMTDILPRVHLLQQSGINFDEIDWFLINNDRLPFQQETLKQLGIPADKVLVSDRHPHIQAPRLIVPSYPGHLGWMQPWALTFLRQTFLPYASSVSLPRRVYISRADASYRRVLNEAELLDHLSRFGFASVTLESLSLAEQIALFSQAEIVVAPHGSGLTNLAFCQPGTRVIELFSPNYIRHYYWVISNLLGLKHYCLVGEGQSCHFLRQLMHQNPLTEDMIVSSDALVGMINMLV